jgi:hypothetical protein
VGYNASNPVGTAQRLQDNPVGCVETLDKGRYGNLARLNLRQDGDSDISLRITFSILGHCA